MNKCGTDEREVKRTTRPSGEERLDYKPGRDKKVAARYQDWVRQAKRDLQHARHAAEREEYEWACFASHQAAEKAIKALYQKLGADAWGHSLSALLANLPKETRPEKKLIDRAKELDKHYVAPRYPNFHPSGAPLDYYTEEEAERAIAYAQEIISFCENNLLR